MKLALIVVQVTLGSGGVELWADVAEVVALLGPVPTLSCRQPFFVNYILKLPVSG